MSSRVVPREKRLKSFDGTRIAYQTIGWDRGDRNPLIVLANGLGGTTISWRSLYQALAPRYRFISWDYRGLFRSSPPKDPGHLKIEDHVKDMDAVLAKEEAERFIIAGWSMGVQVALEAWRSHAQKIEGMILLNGTYGTPFHTAFRSPVARVILPRLNELMQRIGPTLQSAVRPFLGNLIKWQDIALRLKQLGLTAHTLDTELFQEVAKDFAHIDLRVYHGIMKHLSDHSAEDILPEIKAPVLIIAGDADILTPPSVTDTMMKKLPRAELFTVPRGTHYSLMEYPEIITMRIDKWLRDKIPYVAKGE